MIYQRRKKGNPLHKKGSLAMATNKTGLLHNTLMINTGHILACQ